MVEASAAGRAIASASAVVIAKAKIIISKAWDSVFGNSTVTTIPELNAVANKALDVHQPITGILRSNGTIEAYVQDTSYSYNHQSLGLTKGDLGFNMFYYEGRWVVNGSGYAASQGWAMPTAEQREMILQMFGLNK